MEDRPEIAKKLDIKITTKEPLPGEENKDDAASVQRQSFLLNKGPKIEQICSPNLLGNNCIYKIKDEEEKP